MSTLFALLQSQQTPLQTRKGLIVLGLQNDFVAPDGRLPVNDTGYLDRIIQLVPAFREFGDLIWVRSEFEDNRPVNGLDTPGDTVIAGGFQGTDPEVPSSNDERDPSPVPTKKFKVAPDFYSTEWALNADLQKSSPKSTATLPQPTDILDDEELFLTRTPGREPCCLRGSRGADYADRVKPLIQQGKDLQVTKSHYSAFGATSLLLTLRSKLITELYVCGNMTNLSVYATAMDAARYGISITLVTDCLGYRQQDRHELAIKQLREIMSADVMKSSKVIETLRNPEQEVEYSDEDEDDDDDEVSETEGEAKPKENSGAADLLEADSDESDGEVDLSTVRPRRLDPPIELPFRRASGKHSLAVESRVPSFKHAKSARTQPDRRSRSSEQSRSTPRSFHGPRNELVQPKLDTASSYRRLGVLDSPDSPPYQQPWLDIIPQNINSTSGSGPISSIRPKHRGLAAMAALAGLHQSTVDEYERLMRLAREEQNEADVGNVKSRPLFGEDKKDESAGSQILYDLLSQDLAETIFEALKDEIDWQSMYHLSGEVPRLVCCQGTIDKDGSQPVYRHPSDQSIPLQAWSPTVERVRKAAEKMVGHPLNHALIQLYRNGNDFISEHSDKTLDIAPNSKIVNVSFGAQRTMRLRTKRGAQSRENPQVRTTYRIPMPHNSMITMSLPTNAQYLHGINADKRPGSELVEAEKAYDGQRISLTFRNIGTFLSGDSKLIWGQGAKGKEQVDARLVVNADPEKSERMVKAFGAENQASTINWEEIYGEGFDVLHLK